MGPITAALWAKKLSSTGTSFMQKLWIISLNSEMRTSVSDSPEATRSVA